MAKAETTQDVFPRELLSHGFEERHNYFLEYKAEHAMLNYIHQRVLHAILYPAQAGIVVVLGPTGVGKTTLQLGLEHDLNTRFEKEMQRDPGFMPFSGIDAPAPYQWKYRWKAHFKRALQSLKDPFVDSRNNSIDDLQNAYEKAVANRRLKAFFIDDGQHMTTGAKDPVGQFDMVKSMVNTSQVQHVILGTYDLVPFLTMNGQLARRTIYFDFKRYGWDKKGIEVYGDAVDAFQRNLPLPEVFDMRPHLEFLYERTIGCVGVLKDWLMRALDLTLKQGGCSLTLKVLEDTSLKDDQLNQMFDEAEKGEQQIRHLVGKTARDRFRQRLGWESRPPRL